MSGVDSSFANETPLVLTTVPSVCRRSGRKATQAPAEALLWKGNRLKYFANIAGYSGVSGSPAPSCTTTD